VSETYAEFVDRVRAIVARYSLMGPLPTEFTVYPEELERGAIVRAKMLRINSRDEAPERAVVAVENGTALIGTTAKEVFPMGEIDEQIHARLREFAIGLYEHEFYEWFKVDGVLVDDPHADDGKAAPGVS
jgi:hypothetical protein